jgi:hypothetical protein
MDGAAALPAAIGLAEMPASELLAEPRPSPPSAGRANEAVAAVRRPLNCGGRRRFGGHVDGAGQAGVACPPAEARARAVPPAGSAAAGAPHTPAGRRRYHRRGRRRCRRQRAGGSAAVESVCRRVDDPARAGGCDRRRWTLAGGGGGPQKGCGRWRRSRPRRTEGSVRPAGEPQPAARREGNAPCPPGAAAAAARTGGGDGAGEGAAGPPAAAAADGLGGGSGDFSVRAEPPAPPG